MVRDDRVDVLMPRTPGTWQDDPVDGAGSRGRRFIRIAKHLSSRVPRSICQGSVAAEAAAWDHSEPKEREPVTDGGVRELGPASVLMPPASRSHLGRRARLQ